jgi:hypothetical protein
MGLEPTTFCMAKGPSDPTTADAAYEISSVTRKRPVGVIHRQTVSGRRT